MLVFVVSVETWTSHISDGALSDIFFLYHMEKIEAILFRKIDIQAALFT